MLNVHCFVVLGTSEPGDPGDYELHLPDVKLGYVLLSDISPLHLDFTLCFWLKTQYSGFFIEHKIATEQIETLVLGIYCDNDTFTFQLGNRRRYQDCFISFLQCFINYAIQRIVEVLIVYAGKDCKDYLAGGEEGKVKLEKPK